MSPLRAFQCRVVGVLAATDSLFATKYISGRVESAMYLCILCLLAPADIDL